MQSFGGGWSTPAPAKFCCSCNSAAAALYCRIHSAFLCLRCDEDIHYPTKLLGARHARVWLCEVCEQSPAAVTCNADAAALCVACDADIHSVNPLARRHERSAVEPFYDSPEFAAKPTSVLKFFLSNELKSEEFFFSEMNSLFDLDYTNGGGDGVVPAPAPAPATDHSAGDFCGLEFFTRPELDTVSSYPSQSLSQSVSSSSLDVGVVPDRNFAGEEAFLAGETAVSTAGEKATQLRGMDREARVLRYREKKKNRKFEKTIRYASRKAYAEIRPRVKGRFVKRTEDPYGIVPSL